MERVVQVKKRRPPKNSRAFKAEGTAMVVGEGIIIDKKPIDDSTVMIKIVGETIGGAIPSCPKWPALAGTQFIIVEDCTTVLNMATGKLTSEATGGVTITRDNVPGLTGKYRASMRGDFKMGADGSSLVFGTVHSEGSINLTGEGAGFNGAKVKAEVMASLDQFEYAPGKFTLRGPISIAGTRC